MNASLPMLRTAAGIVTFSTEEFAKARSPMSVTPSGRTTSVALPL